MSPSWLRNMPRSLDYPDVGADAILAGAVHAFPDRTALRDGEATLSYTELRDHALRIAAGLRERGIQPGDVVALHMPNTMWFMVAYYGVLCAGAAVAPINPTQPVHALRTQLADCAAAAVISHPTCVDVAVHARPDALRLIVCVPPSAAAPGPDMPAAVAGVVPLARLLETAPLRGYRVDPGLVAHLQLTGGTTGRSKAVRVLHRNLVSNVFQVACYRSSSLPGLDEGGGARLVPVPEAMTRNSIVPGTVVQVAVAPLFHGLGLVSYNLSVIVGSTVVVAGRFDAEALLDDIERFGVTDMTGSPAMFYALLRSSSIESRDLSSVRLITCGAAPIDTGALGELARLFGNAYIAEGYGLSEATMGVSGPPMSQEPVRGSVGVPLFDTEVQIRGIDGAAVLPTGETGEIWVRGPQVTDGYQGDPERTAEQFVDDWLRTGDLGRVDEDGYIFLVGRSKDMLIYKGYNVYPQPLEEILCSHPAVSQAAVVGLHSGAVGEVPVAFVVLRPGAAVGDAIDAELIAYVAERVAPYQRVREVRVLDALPLTPTGKVLKSELRAGLAEQPATLR